MPALSGQIAFSGKLNKPWFGFEVYNDGDAIPARALVIWQQGAPMSSVAGIALVDVGVGMGPRRLLGYAADAIAPEKRGFVAAGGYDQIRVYGSVAVDDYLMHGSAPVVGCAEATTVIDDGNVFAIAKQSNATDTTNNIRAIVFPWRL